MIVIMKTTLSSWRRVPFPNLQETAMVLCRNPTFSFTIKQGYQNGFPDQSELRYFFLPLPWVGKLGDWRCREGRRDGVEIVRLTDEKGPTKLSAIEKVFFKLDEKQKKNQQEREGWLNANSHQSERERERGGGATSSPAIDPTRLFKSRLARQFKYHVLIILENQQMSKGRNINKISSDFWSSLKI